MALARLTMESLDAQLDALAAGLRSFVGHRTLWIGPTGELCHTEPDDELEDAGYLYVATVLRPSADDLASHVMRYFQAPKPPPRVHVRLEPALA